MPNSFNVELVLLAVLLAYLATSIGLRSYRESTREKLLQSQWPPKAFDAAPLLLRLDKLKKDYAGVASFRQKTIRYRTILISKARRAILSLPYFCQSEKGDVLSSSHSEPPVKATP